MTYFYFVTVVLEGPGVETPEWRSTSWQHKFRRCALVELAVRGPVSALMLADARAASVGMVRWSGKLDFRCRALKKKTQ